MDFDRRPPQIDPEAKPSFTGEDIQRNLARLGKYRIPLQELSNDIGKNSKRGISPQRISAILKSDRPTEAAVKRIAEGLGIDPAELIRGEVLSAPDVSVSPVSDIPVHLRDPDPPSAWPRDQFAGVDPIDWSDYDAKDMLSRVPGVMKSVVNADILNLTHKLDIEDVRQFRDDMVIISRAARRMVERLRDVIDRKESDFGV
jgi:transcriptional regulator with XRE-family HTH domain